MRIKEGFVLRDVCGEKVVMGEGLKTINFSKMIHFNDTAAYLWNELQGKEFDVSMMAELLCGKYEVGKELAFADSQSLADKLIEAGVFEA